jgi:NAD(P)-dependent dehydrogenase (short-subunit alcohol dehydrogenase family)
MDRRTKRTCLLTGASGRLGTAFCRAYASRYDIVAVYHHHEPVFPSQLLEYVDPLDLTADLPANVHRVWAMRADLSSAEDVCRVVDVATARLGGVDLLVNAAVHSVWAGFLDGSTVLDSWAVQAAVNVEAPLRLVHELCTTTWRASDEENRLRRRNVVNLSSTAGIFAYPGQGQSVYAATKAALNHLTVHLADELRPVGIRVNAVAPDSFPSRVETATVAQAVVDLDSSLATGEIVVVDADGVRYLEDGAAAYV